MTPIEKFAHAAGKIDAAGLATVSPDELAAYVAQPRGPWWRRTACVEALAGRVPEAAVPALLDRIRDPKETAQVRIALLRLLGDRPQLLPWLRASGEQSSLLTWPYGMREAILGARGAAGDLAAAPALVALAHAPWRHGSAVGEAGVAALVARHGAAVVDARLDGALPEVRVFRLRTLGADLLHGLADPDPRVAEVACELAVAREDLDDDTLRDQVIAGPSVTARAWAAVALARRGRAIRELWAAIDAPRIELPGLPAEVRTAILREYEPSTGTDPRWIVERALLDAPSYDDQADLERALAALRDGGFAPGPATPIGEVEQQGEGSYRVIALQDSTDAIAISTLAPFVRGSERARAVLEAAGLRWIDDALGSLRVLGYNVYYFGKREPLDVGTLLFYWQD